MADLYCKICGNIFIQPTDLYCRKCGAPLRTATGAEQPVQPTPATGKKLDRLALIGDGFTPTRQDMEELIRFLQGKRPDILTGQAILTLLEWPGGIPPEYNTAGMAAAVMQSDWGKAVLAKYFQVDIINHAEIFFLEFTNNANQREAAIVAAGGLPARQENEGEADRFQPLTVWTRYPDIHPLRQVRLSTLAIPVFQRNVVTSPEPAASRKEQILRLVSPVSSYQKMEDCLALEKATRNLPVDFPDFALGYLWRMLAFAGLGRFEDAFQLLDSGLENCPDPLYICEACAYLCTKTGLSARFGWHMQEVYLGTRGYGAYLVLAQAALYCEMDELSRGLFAASDVVVGDAGMWRPSDRMIAEINALVDKDPRGVNSALTRFAACIKPILEELKVVPDDRMQRTLWLQPNNAPRRALAEYLTSDRRKFS